MSNFRLQGKKYLVTWPQARDLNIEIIHTHLETIGEIDYCCICEELHQDGNSHFHAVVLFVNRIRKRGNPFNIEECNSNVQIIRPGQRHLKDALAYVKKEGTWREWGNRPDITFNSNRKEKLAFIKEHTFKECYDSGLFSISELKSVDALKTKLIEQREDRERVVYWFWGPTGSGKTREAWRIARESYTLDDICVLTGENRDFKHGYKGERCVIFDDFRNGCVRFNELLSLCDRYPVNVNVKHSNSPWLADLIIFTSPFTPNETFVKRGFNGELIEREDIDQMLRRINEIREFKL